VFSIFARKIMKIAEVAECLENYAPLSLQEDYDNAGLLIGSADEECTGILSALDVTEEIISEAAQKKCNLIVAHHPIIFKGLKKLNGKNYAERTVISAIKNNISVYAIHTNLDNILQGVNNKIAQKLDLQDIAILSPKRELLKKLITFSPIDYSEKVRNALFEAGAGSIGKYNECSFNIAGEGTFKANEGASPFVGNIGERHTENEVRIEVIFPAYLESRVIWQMKNAHPYQEVAYDIYPLSNKWDEAGSGLIGTLKEPVEENELLIQLKSLFGLSVVRHTPLLHQKVKKIAVCGGAGSFLVSAAKACGADVFITGDIKYHEFFEADRSILIADIGHYESEQFTIDLITEILHQKFPNFAILKTEINTNPVNYFS
jgi:dinuclear metal center YbgI/SA1388 family protein